MLQFPFQYIHINGIIRLWFFAWASQAFISVTTEMIKRFPMIKNISEKSRTIHFYLS